jgi:lycopene cyclase domain-containing protein
MSHLVYLAVLLGCLAVTVPLDIVYGAKVFARPWFLMAAILPVLIVFSGWDVYAISRRQWTYNRHWVTGIDLPGRLPLEEGLFFVVIPLVAILTFESVGRQLARSPRRSRSRSSSRERP